MSTKVLGVYQPHMTIRTTLRRETMVLAVRPMTPSEYIPGKHSSANKRKPKKSQTRRRLQQHQGA